MAGDHRARRLTEEPSRSQHTLDPAPPAPEPPVEIDPSEVLEAPPPQHASAQLEERQKRWFRLRERAMETTENARSQATDPAETPPSDPKA
ncbi:MAG: hypothetical protein WCB19_03500 [Thermoplasmata archaeon]